MREKERKKVKRKIKSETLSLVDPHSKEILRVILLQTAHGSTKMP